MLVFGWLFCWELWGCYILVTAITSLGMLADVVGRGFFSKTAKWAVILPLFDSSSVPEKVEVAFCQYRLQFLPTLVLKGY